MTDQGVLDLLIDLFSELLTAAVAIVQTRPGRHDGDPLRMKRMQAVPNHRPVTGVTQNLHPLRSGQPPLVLSHWLR